MTNFKWLKATSQGLYCEPGQFFIDPIKPVERALITHAHHDHARPDHKKVLATAETLRIMRTRYENFLSQTQSSPYSQCININDVLVTFFPAGHILGSAQILLEYNNQRVIISGDYKRQADPTCEAFQLHTCDLFITEATFGLPVFKHPPINDELNKLLHSLNNFPMRCHLIGAYSLGKCQRMIASLREINYQEPIYLHGAMIKLCELYQELGCQLGDLRSATDLNNQEELKGRLVFSPPSALHSRWIRRLPDVIKSYASGWMQIRARAKQKAIELPLVISDHADWNDLIATINEVNAPEIWTMYGNAEALVHYATQNGLTARALALTGYDEEEGEA